MQHLSKSNSNRSLLIIISASIILFLISFWPGLLSYDSLHAYREALDTVKGGAYPPFVSYFWRVTFPFTKNTWGMFLLNSIIFFLPLFFIIMTLKIRPLFKLFFLCYIFLNPIIIGNTATVWKDVTLTGFLLLSFCTVFAAYNTKNNKFVLLLLHLSFLFAICAALTRSNALPAVVPIVFAISVTLKNKFNLKLIPTSLTFIALSGTLTFTTFFINNYKIPSFKTFAPNGNLRLMATYDIFGSAYFARTNIMINDNKTVSSSYINDIYSSKHYNIMKIRDKDNVLLLQPLSNKNVFALWKKTFSQHTYSYFKHRLKVFSNLVGTSGVFYPTHGIIDQNEFHIDLTQSKWRDAWINYINSFKDIIFFTPYFLLLIMLFIIILRGNRLRHQLLWLPLLISLAYILPLFLVTPAADSRYALPTIIFGFIFIIKFYENSKTPEDL